MIESLIGFYVDMLLKERPSNQKPLPQNWDGLPLTVSELEREIARQDLEGYVPLHEDESDNWIFLRLAMAELLIRRSLAIEDISSEEADILREKHIRSILAKMEQVAECE